MKLGRPCTERVTPAFNDWLVSPPMYVCLYSTGTLIISGTRSLTASFSWARMKQPRELRWQEPQTCSPFAGDFSTIPVAECDPTDLHG